MADKNTELVGFVCQRCCQPVRLDPSFEKDFTDYQSDEGLSIIKYCDNMNDEYCNG